MKNEQLTINKGNAFLFFVAAFCVMCNFAACKNPESGDDAGMTRYDPDLNGWRTASWSPFVMGDKINGFAYGKINSQDRYVAVSETGMIVWSKDGYDVVSETGVIAWSKDGDIWKAARPERFDTAFRSVCYGETASGGRFVAAGGGGKYTWSNDGENWNEPVGMAGFNGDDINGLAFGAGFFVAVGENKKISWSSDSENWLSSNTANFPVFDINDVAYDSFNGRFYVVGTGGNRAWADNPSGSWNHLGAEDPIKSANIIKVAAGRYGENDPKNIGDGTGIGMLYYDNEKNANRFAVAITRNFIFGDYLDKDLEQFLFDPFTLNGIAWGSPYSGAGNFVAAGSCAMIGFWPNALPSRTGERFFRAISFPDFKKWEISALEACNGRFFIGNVDGKIGYSK